MVAHLRMLLNMYSATTLVVLFGWYVVEDLAGWLPAPVSAEILLNFLCGGFLVKKCWQDT